MRVVITGGAGFIGSHLGDYFISRGDRVVSIDNLITGSLNNIRHLLQHQRFQFIRQNVTEYLDIPGKVDAVLHFASPASPRDYARLPIQTLKVGALGTHNALGLAKAKNARFLLASTSEVYGDPLEHPQKESYWGNVNPVGPRGVYDESKRFAEAITMAYHRVHGIETRIARIFNTYGPRMRLNDGRALPTFFAQALRGQNLTIFGKGHQTRSFCYISDMIEGLIKLLASKETNPVNLGNPDEITIRKLVREIIELTGSNSKIVCKALPQDDPQRRQPDITRARTILKWRPRVSRRDGLSKTLVYFKGVLKCRY